MHKRLIFILLLLPTALCGQVWPKENSSLNYRIIDFVFTDLGKAKLCSLEIAQGNWSDEPNFKRNIKVKVPCTPKGGIAEVPEFGRSYTWRYCYTVDGKATSSDFMHFNTSNAPVTDTSAYRLRILKKTQKYKDGFVFSDGHRALYDMEGKLVWFLEQLGGKPIGTLSVRDLKITAFGTITLLVADVPYEIDLNGNILWQTPQSAAPDAAVKEHFHHEFTRLGNGHYMVMAIESFPWVWKHLGTTDSELVMADSLAPDNGSKVVDMPFGSLLEYDQKGSIVWRWSSKDYYRNTAAVKQMKVTALLDAHENAFSFDEKHGFIYVNAKGNSEILKVQYPSGKVVATYGSGFEHRNNFNANQMFCEQHGCKKSDAGYLYLFNNNVCNSGAPAKIVLLQETPKTPSGLTKLWEYEYPVSQTSDSKMPGTSGGNVQELDKGEFLITYCLPHGNMAIVNKSKTLLWDALLERKEKNALNWEETPQYRGSMIRSRALLNTLVRNAHKE